MIYTDTTKLKAHLASGASGIKPPRPAHTGHTERLVVDKAHPWITVKKRTRQPRAAANIVKMKKTATK